MLVFLTNLSLIQFQVGYLALFCSSLSFRSYIVTERVHKNIQQMLVIPQGCILCPALSLLYIHDLLDDVICNIAIYAAYSSLYSKCLQASGLWQQL